jgi:hypothetical protein
VGYAPLTHPTFNGSIIPEGLRLRTLFALTLLVSAALLFVVQPLMARMVLPMLGGTPAVWNTCMVFFQTALLAGYAYAHASNTWLGVRVQSLVHVGLLLLALVFLPIVIPDCWVGTLESEVEPSFSLLGALVASVGLPFFAVSSTAPLLQRWFARTDHPSASDPYFLYGASNVGSMLALVGYPFLVEPNLRLALQSRYWAAGYMLLVVLIIACALATWRSKRGPSEDHTVGDGSDRPGLGRMASWVALAFIPSSLMLGVTTYLTTDLASIPLLWVVPLALYLLTFILVFARRQILPLAWLNRAQPLILIILAMIMCLNSVQSLMIPVHLLAFFVVAMVCHGELVRLRPAARDLTAFYLAMSFGGALGGVFNALIAPVAFDWIAEYPLAVVLAAMVRPGGVYFSGSARSRVLDFLAPAVLAIVLIAVTPRLIGRYDSQGPGLVVNLAAGLVALVCFSFKDRPVRFALGIGAALLASHLTIGARGQTLYRERNFFGVARVWEDRVRGFHRLTHGNTLHGQQSTDPALRREPLTYYHRTVRLANSCRSSSSGPHARRWRSSAWERGLLPATPGRSRTGRSMRSTPRSSRSPAIPAASPTSTIAAPAPTRSSWETPGSSFEARPMPALP